MMSAKGKVTMYAESTRPVDALDGRVPPAVVGQFREQYAGHFGDAVGRIVPILREARDPAGLNPWGEWRREAEAFVRLYQSEQAATKAAWAEVRR